MKQIYQRIGTNIFVKFGADESSPPGYYEVRRNDSGNFEWYGTSPYNCSNRDVEQSGRWIKIA